MERKYELFDLPCPGCGQTTFTLPLIPKATHRVICPKCRTPSVLHVTSNLGIRVYTPEEFERVKCKKCKSTGKCPTCIGTGKVKCPKCDGRGFYKDSWYYGCERCGGSGSTGYESEFASKIIKGSGKVECDYCKGTGVCPDCGGEGVLL